MMVRNITLTDALDRFISQEIESGAYENESEVVRAALRVLKAREEARTAKVERLRAAVQEAVDAYECGEGEVVDDLGAYFDRLESEIDAETDASAAAG